MISDPIADMLTRIRNGLMARHKQVVVPGSKVKVAMARILKEEGFIRDFEVTKDVPQPQLRIVLKYNRDRKSIITGLQRISKPGRRVYVKRSEIPWVLSGLGIAILSTPQGPMTGQKARRLGLGGEVLCYVW
ncbi:MAG: 30S ribosomal protein S8 [Anaerolineae bacterium CG2_30_64_16]|nr:MAG: 30S ribosomal protein S8 [Anaerolineae bacterium CG2_30_64_16]